MLKLSFKTSKQPVEIMNQAEKFFEGYGLRIAEKGQNAMRMEGGGGYVRIEAAHGPQTEVTLETREWEFPVK